jgi:predicted RNA-binding Zn ribbon-like protein
VVSETHHWQAPGRLELARALLNTRLPSPARPPHDRLPELATDPARWADSFPGMPRPSRGQLAALAELRNGLRALLDPPAGPAVADQAAWLTGWVERVGLSVVVRDEGGALAVGHAWRPRAGLAGAVVQAVVAAVADGSWSRLKQCPDCRLVFFDQTRNSSKVWCGMYAGRDGRACGTIAKVRRYRARRAAATPEEA